MTDGTTTTTGDTTTTTTTATPWHAGIEPELLGHWQNKGWKYDDAKTVAIEATKAHRAAQALVGVPETQLLRLPKDAADEAGWKTVWSRLGAPADPKEYDFAAVKHADGSAPAAALLDTIRATAAALHIPKERAAELAAPIIKHMDALKAEQTAVQAGKLAEEKSALAADWGPNAAANLFIAQQGAKVLGVTPEQVAALESVIGYKGVMQAFHKVGKINGEHKFVGGGPGGDGATLTKEGASARLAELSADSGWRQRVLNGDAAALRERRALNIIISGDTGDYRAA